MSRAPRRPQAPAGRRAASASAPENPVPDPTDFELAADVAARVRFNDAGLVPAVAQAHGTGEVLMLAWMDARALACTLATRRATYWSRSRGEYWIKGLTSGHTQQVRSVALDCDGDTVLVVVEQTGGACHTGARTCFDADVVLADPDQATAAEGRHGEDS